MKHRHFTPFTLSTYLSTERSTSTIMLPLLICQECRRSLETLSEWLEALDHFDPLVGPEYVTRYELFFQLFRENDTPEARLEAIDTDEMYQHWGLTHLLIEESKTKRLCYPNASKEFAELAVRNAALLDPAFYHPKWIADLCTAATVNFAEAQLALDDSESAQELLQEAANWQLNGTLRPRIARLVARLRARLMWEFDRQDKKITRLLQEIDLSEPENDSEECNLLSWFFERWRDRDLTGHDAILEPIPSRPRR